MITKFSFGAIFVAATISAAEAQVEISADNVFETARNHITEGGGILVRLGNRHPEDIIGRAMHCRYSADGAGYVLDSSSLIPINFFNNVTPTRVDIGNQNDYEIRSRSVISAGSGLWFVQLRAEQSALSILKIRKQAQASFPIDVSLVSPAVRQMISSILPVDSDYDHLCFVTQVTAWSVNYENYRSQSINAQISGSWITDGQASYLRENAQYIPRELVTISIDAVHSSWFRTGLPLDTISDVAGLNALSHQSTQEAVETVLNLNAEAFLLMDDDAFASGDRISLMSSTELLASQVGSAWLAEELELQQRLPGYQMQIQQLNIPSAE